MRLDGHPVHRPQGGEVERRHQRCHGRTRRLMTANLQPVARRAERIGIVDRPGRQPQDLTLKRAQGLKRVGAGLGCGSGKIVWHSVPAVSLLKACTLKTSQQMAKGCFGCGAVGQEVPGQVRYSGLTLSSVEGVHVVFAETNHVITDERTAPPFLAKSIRRINLLARKPPFMGRSST